MHIIHKQLLDIFDPGVTYTPQDRAWYEYQWMMGTTFEHLGYEPNDLQLGIHMDRHRVRQVAGGERAGKSYLMAKDGVAKTVWHVKQGRYDQLIWILGPDYEQPRVEFEYMLDDLLMSDFKLDGRPRMRRGTSSPWVARIQGLGMMQTKTTSDIRKIASKAPDLILMCEAAQMDIEAYYKARGRAAEKKAPILMGGTFEDSNNWYADMFNKWKSGWGDNKSFSLPTWSNTVVYPGGIDDPEIKRLQFEFPPDLFMERFGAIPHRPHTLMLRMFDYAKHVRDDIVYNPKLPVEITVDPGYDPGYYHVSAIQIIKKDGKKEQVWVIDEIHKSRWLAEKIIRECKRRPWWKSVTGGVIDIAGRAHQGDRSQIEIWRNKARVNLRSNQVSVMAGINRHKTFLIDPETGEPRMFHNPNCVMGLREYGLYKRKPDNERTGIQSLPIDRNNHAMKAYAYYLFDRYGPVERVHRKRGRTSILKLN